jgi:hypothetical protein
MMVFVSVELSESPILTLKLSIGNSNNLYKISDL